MLMWGEPIRPRLVQLTYSQASCGADKPAMRTELHEQQKKIKQAKRAIDEQLVLQWRC